MQIKSYTLEATLSFDPYSIEEALLQCEDAINNITDDESARFKLKSAIHELLINCLEHGYKKASGKVFISFRRDTNCIYFEICDEGSGIDPATLNLDRDVNNPDTVKGRGWGLVITNRLSRDMKITPNTPKGTRISLTIPLQPV